MTSALVQHRLGEPLHRVLGKPTANKLAKAFGMATVGDLLRHYPRRYETRGELTPLADLEVGAEVTVLAEVRSVSSRRMSRRRGELWEIVVTDGAEDLRLVFFGARHTGRQLQRGQRGLFSGTVRLYDKRRELAHPDFTLLADEQSGPAAEAAVEDWADRPIPVYPAAAGIRSWHLSRWIGTALQWLSGIPGELPDPLPHAVRERHRLPGLAEALHAVHRPADHAEVTRALARLRWEEAFVLQTALVRRRALIRELAATPRTERHDGLLAAFDARLPFELTGGQRRVGTQIREDLARAHPMHRLLQGEVGSGKTVVAVRAMLTVVDAGGQAALLAPTEVLAQQHHRSLCTLLGPLAAAGRLDGDASGTSVALLTGSMGQAARRAALLEAASGQAGIVVGTHALLTEHVEFADLGLVVVDEQHRFGVEQRDALRSKGKSPPHVLVMTATPIPRTVAMTVFGDLDVSTLEELPSGRAPISTHVVPVSEKPHYLDRTWRRIREEIAAGHQAYVVCPRIGDEDPDPGSEAAEDRRPAAAVLEVAPGLTAGPLAGLRTDILHGRLATDAKDAAMGAFTAGDLDVLIATTVIEVGVDVANATVMVVLDADRFGISQLHQLRGRVGRGAAPGLCLLVTEAPAGSPARQRLDAVAATCDGFELARLDLLARREGDVLGAAQSGRRSSLRLLSVIRDADVIAQARAESRAVVDVDPGLNEHPALAAALADLLDDDRAGFLEKA